MARILVIDDQAEVRDIVVAMLSAAGHHPTEAPHGVIGVALHYEHKFDLVISDLDMPLMDGIATITELTRNDPGIPIIAMSGGSAGPSSEAALRAGARSFLSKPFRRAELMAAVDNAIAPAQAA